MLYKITDQIRAPMVIVIESTMML